MTRLRGRRGCSLFGLFRRICGREIERHRSLSRVLQALRAGGEDGGVGGERTAEGDAGSSSVLDALNLGSSYVCQCCRQSSGIASENSSRYKCPPNANPTPLTPPHLRLSSSRTCGCREGRLCAVARHQIDGRPVAGREGRTTLTGGHQPSRQGPWSGSRSGDR